MDIKKVSAEKLTVEKKKSSATPAGDKTCNLLIPSLALYQEAILAA